MRCRLFYVILSFEMRWLQWLCNDVTSGTELEDVKCGDDGCQTEGPENRECFPISIPPNDPFFAGRANCLMFVRSQETPNEDCTPGFSFHLPLFVPSQWLTSLVLRSLQCRTCHDLVIASSLISI